MGAAASSDIRTMFSGLMSRWQTPQECMWYTADAICLISSDATFSVYAPVLDQPLEHLAAFGELHHEAATRRRG